MDALIEEKRLAEAREIFSNAFDSIQNATIEKTQTNKFALTFKYPLLIIFTILLISFLIIIGAFNEIIDVFYIIVIIFLTISFFAIDVVLVLTWIRTIKNSKKCETMLYKKGEVTTIVTTVDGTGVKVDWPGVSIFFDKKENVEIIESPDVKYNPFPLKKFRGHSRNGVLLNKDFLLKYFFMGCSAIIEEDKVELSSGLSFKLSHGILTEIIIEGNYVECYENNFPLYAILTDSSNYEFKYTFSAINDPSFIQRFPRGTREVAEIFKLELPNDSNLMIPDEPLPMYQD